MILQSLVEMAQREGLVEDSSYQSGEVSFAIVLARDGRFLQLLDLRSERGKKRVGKKMWVPFQRVRTRKDVAHFLVDKSEYTLGSDPRGSREAGVLAKRFGMFRALIQKAVEEAEAPELRAILTFLDSVDDVQRCTGEAEVARYQGNDQFCFEVAGRFVQDVPEVRRFWAGFALGTISSRKKVACLVCGEVRSVADVHPQIKLRGGSPSGVALVSFNAKAFEKHGWSNNENAPVCDACAKAYSTALRRCLNERYPDPSDPERPLRRQSAVLSDNLTAVYWMEPPNSKILDGIEALTAQFESPWKGSPASNAEGSFHCIFLQGGEGRASIRGWHTATANQVESNLNDWFEQTRVDRTRPLRALLNGLVAERKGKREGETLPERFVRSMFLAAVFGLPLPGAVLAAAVARNKAERVVIAERAALLQAYFARMGRRELMGLDLDNRTPAYRLGRLLAVLQRQQRAFNPNLKQNLTNRFFSAMSMRPASVFPALMRLGRIHTAGLLPTRRSASLYFEGRIADVLSTVYPPVPVTFDLAEQGEFALGYYHELQDDKERWEQFEKDRENEEGEDTDAA